MTFLVSLLAKNARGPSALTRSKDSYAPAFYWSIIETNVGILSACLPTLRPLYDGYKLKSITSRLTSTFNTSKSALRSRDNVRLNSLEKGYSDSEHKGIRDASPYEIEDDIDSGH